MILKIISGGQTGADIGGLKAGEKLKIPTGGLCPYNWRTEEGSMPSLAKYNVTCHSSELYQIRTRLNVAKSDGTIILGWLESGSKLTMKICIELNKPYIHIAFPTTDLLDSTNQTLFNLWLLDNNIETLNVAGNRESKNKGIEQYTIDFLVGALSNE